MIGFINTIIVRATTTDLWYEQVRSEVDGTFDFLPRSQRDYIVNKICNMNRRNRFEPGWVRVTNKPYTHRQSSFQTVHYSNFSTRNGTSVYVAIQVQQ